MDYETWNKWVKFVGKKGGYGSDLAANGTVNNQGELDNIIGKYAYGYNVVAGRANYRDEIKLANGGAAGGYVGSMQTGTITNAVNTHRLLVRGTRIPYEEAQKIDEEVGLQRTIPFNLILLIGGIIAFIIIWVSIKYHKRRKEKKHEQNN